MYDPDRMAAEIELLRGSFPDLEVKEDGGRTWDVLGGGLPSTQVSDLVYHPRDHIIVISTYGHGVWALNAERLR